ncbi:hypothetical protein TVAG_392540 [Trichomonas vaginalis G3]|uniref:Uncharacterized protein n=1 Tax=Trichomonas vaginalis (strain ATCC PRA-98 / G3) TaxID=412133 RepID=A2DWV5_TRIV3|nr:hypothetical protein TVAGG3_0839330 [Trichomonas vaginalis G3]EAY15137.1 hypothetical protein TVAG_392540 [Trichomonas vaginalis G3]KAI5499171.1 hypothetical protein TVAGG3_0839330 [Trichomonas vaginalis G3]|eukprot:XP_001327360.1 hypothetical protein [Trichomonas vaginalis G3]
MTTSSSKTGKNLIENYKVNIELPDSLPCPLQLNSNPKLSKSQEYFDNDTLFGSDDDSDDIIFAHQESSKVKEHSNSRSGRSSQHSKESSTPKRRKRTNFVSPVKKGSPQSKKSSIIWDDSDDEDLKRIETTYRDPDFAQYQDSSDTDDDNIKPRINDESWNSSSPVQDSPPNGFAIKLPNAISPPKSPGIENPRLLKAKQKLSNRIYSPPNGVPQPSPPSSPVPRNRPYIRRGTPPQDKRVKTDNLGSDTTVSDSNITGDEQSENIIKKGEAKLDVKAAEHQEDSLSIGQILKYTISIEIKNKLGFPRYFFKIFNENDALFSFKTKKIVDNQSIFIEKGSDPHISSENAEGVILIANNIKDFSLRGKSLQGKELITLRILEKDHIKLFWYNSESQTQSTSLKAIFTKGSIETVDIVDGKKNIWAKFTLLSSNTFTSECFSRFDPMSIITIAFVLFVNK